MICSQSALNTTTLAESFAVDLHSETQDLSRIYPAHHELESQFIIIITVVIIITFSMATLALLTAVQGCRIRPFCVADTQKYCVSAAKTPMRALLRTLPIRFLHRNTSNQW